MMGFGASERVEIAIGPASRCTFPVGVAADGTLKR
jgi:hypothetical protein